MTVPVVSVDIDSDIEMERETEAKRRATARRHWGVIRRYVAERVKQRKEGNTAQKSWNILRHQLRAQTNAELVRLELYIKYGVLKANHPDLKPVRKPCLSDSAVQLIQGFQSVKINHLHSSDLEKS